MIFQDFDKFLRVCDRFVHVTLYHLPMFVDEFCYPLKILVCLCPEIEMYFLPKHSTIGEIRFQGIHVDIVNI